MSTITEILDEISQRADKTSKIAIHGVDLDTEDQIFAMHSDVPRLVQALRYLIQEMEDDIKHKRDTVLPPRRLAELHAILSKP